MLDDAELLRRSKMETQDLELAAPPFQCTVTDEANLQKNGPAPAQF